MTVEVTGDDETLAGPYAFPVALTKGHQRQRTRILRHMNYSFAKHTFRNVDGAYFALSSAEAYVVENSRLG